MNSVENIIIIGGGPAGLAAAIYNARANLNPLMFAGSPPGGQLTLTSDVENYPGFESILGPELIEKMRSHARKFGTRIVDENVVRVDFSKRPFEIYLSEAIAGPAARQPQLSRLNEATPIGAPRLASPAPNRYLANAILIATGAKAIWLGLESERRLRGKGVSACATCDGFFFKEKVVGVVGGGDTAMEEALTLTKFASKIYIIHRRDAFRASKIMQDRVLKHPKIEVIWNTEVVEVIGEQKVEEVKLVTTSLTGSTSSTNSTLKLDGLFIAIGHKPDTDIFKGQIELDEKGYILTSQRKAINIVKLVKSVELVKLAEANSTSLTNLYQFNPNYQYTTSVPGVFAAGDCVDSVYRQAGTAVGMGIAAALEVERALEQ